MSLQRSDLEKIFSYYSSLRLKNDEILQKRIEEVESISPDYKNLNKKIRDLGFKSAMKTLNTTKVFNKDLLDKKMLELENKKIEILKELKLPTTYLNPIYLCPLCKDTGFIENKKCDCFIKKEIEFLYNKSSLKGLNPNIGFKDFKLSFYSDKVNAQLGQAPLDLAKKAVTTAKNFVKNFNNHSENLLIYGDIGIGKTHLITIISNELQKTSNSVIYISSNDFFNSSRFLEYDSHYNNFDCIEDFINADLLIIDDLGSEYKTSLNSPKLFYYMNERFLQKKSTVISTNLDLKELDTFYSRRILSRLVAHYTKIRLVGDDIRLLNAIEEKQKH